MTRVLPMLWSSAPTWVCRMHWLAGIPLNCASRSTGKSFQLTWQSRTETLQRATSMLDQRTPRTKPTGSQNLSLKAETTSPGDATTT